MKRDRLVTLVRVRELLERQRLAEQAVAARVLEATERAERAARAAFAASAPLPGSRLLPGALQAERAQGVALGDVAAQAGERVAVALRTHQQAEQQRRAAAIQRRSAERLHERRTVAAAREQARHEDRARDEVALTTWRRGA